MNFKSLMGSKKVLIGAGSAAAVLAIGLGVGLGVKDKKTSNDKGAITTNVGQPKPGPGATNEPGKPPTPTPTFYAAQKAVLNPAIEQSLEDSIQTALGNMVLDFTSALGSQTATLNSQPVVLVKKSLKDYKTVGEIAGDIMKSNTPTITAEANELTRFTYEDDDLGSVTFVMTVNAMITELKYSRPDGRSLKATEERIAKINTNLEETGVAEILKDPQSTDQQLSKFVQYTVNNGASWVTFANVPDTTTDKQLKDLIIGDLVKKLANENLNFDQTMSIPMPGKLVLSDALNMETYGVEKDNPAIINIRTHPEMVIVEKAASNLPDDDNIKILIDEKHHNNKPLVITKWKENVRKQLSNPTTIVVNESFKLSDYLNPGDYAEISEQETGKVLYTYGFEEVKNIHALDYEYSNKQDSHVIFASNFQDLAAMIFEHAIKIRHVFEKTPEVKPTFTDPITHTSVEIWTANGGDEFNPDLLTIDTRSPVRQYTLHHGAKYNILYNGTQINMTVEAEYDPVKYPGLPPTGKTDQEEALKTLKETMITEIQARYNAGHTGKWTLEKPPVAQPSNIVEWDGFYRTNDRTPLEISEVSPESLIIGYRYVKKGEPLPSQMIIGDMKEFVNNAFLKANGANDKELSSGIDLINGNGWFFRNYDNAPLTLINMPHTGITGFHPENNKGKVLIYSEENKAWYYSEDGVNPIMTEGWNGWGEVYRNLHLLLGPDTVIPGFTYVTKDGHLPSPVKATKDGWYSLKDNTSLTPSDISPDSKIIGYEYLLQLYTLTPSISISSVPWTEINLLAPPTPTHKESIEPPVEVTWGPLPEPAPIAIPTFGPTIAPDLVPPKQEVIVPERVPPKQEVVAPNLVPPKEEVNVPERVPPKEEVNVPERVPPKQEVNVPDHVPPKQEVVAPPHIDK